MLRNEFIGNMPLFKESVSEVLSFQVIFTKLFINNNKKRSSPTIYIQDINLILAFTFSM